jgi:hypothetical protein
LRRCQGILTDLHAALMRALFKPTEDAMNKAPQFHPFDRHRSAALRYPKMLLAGP